MKFIRYMCFAIFLMAPLTVLANSTALEPSVPSQLPPSAEIEKVDDVVQSVTLLFKFERMQSYLEMLEEHIDKELRAMNDITLKLEIETEVQKKIVPEIQAAQEKFQKMQNNPNKNKLMQKSNEDSQILRQLEYDYQKVLQTPSEEEGKPVEESDEAIQLQKDIQEAKLKYEKSLRDYNAEPFILPEKQALYDEIDQKQKTYAISVERTKRTQNKFATHKASIDEAMNRKKELKQELLDFLKSHPDLMPESEEPPSEETAKPIVVEPI